MAEQPVIPQLFGLIPTGREPILSPSAAPAQTSFVYTIPVVPSRPFSHIVVFLLPGIVLPPNTAAAVYISLPIANATTGPNFKFLGGIGPGKESAIFKVSGLTSAANGAGGEVDMDGPLPGAGGAEITIGISVEPADSVSAQMAALLPTNTGAAGAGGEQSAMVLAKAPQQRPDTLVLAQRIIKNAFNFLASFSGNVAGGIEVVPLKAFEEWWKKFEGRVRSDPGFLERDVQD
ncbi:Protein OPI10 [Lachnellula occidentalis]|uniref:Protein OPI10 n=1 Tax=Lachnellula occidentalis TaxID=215460 RepID=A0A8H8UE51_9HELO|nr:Protein OPI10 [Lachnellula occidentalis]